MKKKVLFYIFEFLLIFIVTRFFLIYSSKKKENKEVSICPIKISEKEMIEDSLQLKRIIKRYYAGYKIENNYFDFEDQNQKLIDNCLAKTENGFISTDIFFSEIKEIYSNLKDGHFTFSKNKMNNLTESFNLYRHYDVYFSDIYFIKKNEEYFLNEMDGNHLKEIISYDFLDNNVILMYYPIKGENIYRLGFFSQEGINETMILINNKKLNVPLKKQNQVNYKYLFYPVTGHNQVGICKKETKDTLYVSCNTFGDEKDKYNELNELHISNKKNLILDFRGNGGGYTTHISEFLANLLFSNESDKLRFSITQNLETSVLGSFIKRTFLNRNKNVFKTESNIDIFIIIDSNTCSAPEWIIRTLKKVENINLTIIGQNSGGYLKGSATGFKELRNSRISVQIPRIYNPEKINSNDQRDGEEEYGIFPDIWAINEDLLNTLVVFTGDNELTKTIPLVNSQLE